MLAIHIPFPNEVSVDLQLSVDALWRGGQTAGSIHGSGSIETHSSIRLDINCE
jgi:hypothetical protein